MMNYNVVGACLLVLGVIILDVTLYLGYGLYVTVMQAGASIATQKPANVTVSNSVSLSMGAIIGVVVSTVAAQMPFAKYMSYAIDAIILALFASIGFKISELGVHLFAVGRGKNAVV
jgi:hypothetical protein